MSDMSNTWFDVTKIGREPGSCVFTRTVHRSYLPTLIAEVFTRNEVLLSVLPHERVARAGATSASAG